MLNWNSLLSHPVGTSLFREFATGRLSGRELERNVRFTPLAGDVRRLLRKRGVVNARNVTRKALRRRNIL